MLLKCEDLSCGYDGKAVLKNINFELDQGELWCILGANGVGKSTLFKTILGLLRPIGGKISFYGRKISDWDRKDLAKIASYVPQSHTPPFPYTVTQVLMMGRHPFQGSMGIVRTEDLEAVERALGMLHIEDLSHRIYTQLSGGERQLVLLARAIVQDTPLMILDEPVSNLDFGNSAKVIGHVRDLVKSGKSIIMTTHEPDHAFIEESKVIAIQNRDQIYSGAGRDLVDEKCIKEMYGVDNHIITDPECGQRTCISMYEHIVEE